MSSVGIQNNKQKLSPLNITYMALTQLRSSPFSAEINSQTNTKFEENIPDSKVCN